MSTDYTTAAPIAVKAAPEAPSAKEEAILAAALELFAQRTYDGTPMPLVAERAGVGAGTIYRYFKSKEALVNAVYRRCMEVQRRVLLDITTTGPAREQFRSWWRGMCAFAIENPHAFVFLETHHHASYLDTTSWRVLDEVQSGYRGLIETAQAAGEARQADPEVLMSLVFGAFIGLVKSAGDDGRVLNQDTIAEAEECVWQMLKP